jgi:hypothetical protein
VAAARHVYCAVDDAEVKDRRLLVKAKNNLAPDKGALSYMVGMRSVGTDDRRPAPASAGQVWRNWATY